MGWLFNPNYFGPERRSGKFQVRFFERRRDEEAGSRETLQAVLPKLRARGMRWVDHPNYFGPERRSVFAVYFLERRKHDAAGSPPPLHTALRQLRMRVLDAHDAEAQAQLCDRLIATAILADAQGFTGIGDLLTGLARELENHAEADGDPRPLLRAELNRAEAMQG